MRRWTLRTKRAERALMAKSCFRISSELSGLTEKTRIRRIAQTTSERWKPAPRACRQGKRPTREAIYRVWKRLAARKQIRKHGRLAFIGVTMREIQDEAAFERYARFREAWREATDRGCDQMLDS